jgi:hypothetical protein
MPKIWWIPIAPTKGGSMMGNKMMFVKIFFPGNSYLSAKYAKGSAITKAKAVVAMAIKTEFFMLIR